MSNAIDSVVLDPEHRSARGSRRSGTVGLWAVFGAGLVSVTAAFADTYNPAERPVGRGLIGAGTGAVIGAIAGVGRGVGIGAVAGGGWPP